MIPVLAPPPRPKNRLEAILARTTYDPAKGCRIWTGATRGGHYNKQVYPQIWYRGKMRPGNRVVFELHNKCELDDSVVVKHSCDVSLCIEPTHLSAGTQLSNMQEASERGRFGCAIVGATAE